MLGANVKACNMLRNMHHIVNIVRGGGRTSLFGLYGDVPLDRVWGFLGSQRLGLLANPSQGYPSIKFAGTHLYTWVERGTVRVKCLAQEHNTMSPARTRTRTARSGDEHTNHQATAPPMTWILQLHEFHLTVVTKVNMKVPHIFATHLLSEHKVKHLPQTFRFTAPE